MTIMAHTNKCVGCNETLNDLYYLKVGANLYWHAHCLKCAECACPLQTKCFLNDGKFYCMHDYIKLKHVDVTTTNTCNSEKEPATLFNHQCPTCHLTINSNDYVIKLTPNEMTRRRSVFHLNCFLCSECHKLIAPGHQYAIVNEHIVCSQHYMAHMSNQNELQAKFHFQVTPPPLLTPPPPPPPPQPPMAQVQQPLTSLNYQNRLLDYEQNLGQQDENNNIDRSMLIDHNNNNSHTTTTTTKTTFKHHHEYSRGHNNKNLVLTSRSNLATSNARSSKTTSHSKTSTLAINSSGGSSTSSSNNNNNNNNKKKRIRTSFKHQQLRIMKAHFQINQNPDSKELKELSERTGLQKRVLQVWFQNSRAKQRKTTPTTTTSSSLVGQGMGLGLSAPSSLCTPSGIVGSSSSSSLVHAINSRFNSMEKDESNSGEFEDENFELDEMSSGDDDDDDDDDDVDDDDEVNDDGQTDNENENSVNEETNSDNSLDYDDDEEKRQGRKENSHIMMRKNGKKSKKLSIISPPSSTSPSDYNVNLNNNGNNQVFLHQHQQLQQHSTTTSLAQLNQIHTSFNHQQTPVDFYHCY